MSAFLCTPAHIAVIAQAATKTQGRLDIYILPGYDEAPWSI